jgi:hypothetical protein
MLVLVSIDLLSNKELNPVNKLGQIMSDNNKQMVTFTKHIFVGGWL